MSLSVREAQSLRDSFVVSMVEGLRSEVDYLIRRVSSVGGCRCLYDFVNEESAMVKSFLIKSLEGDGFVVSYGREVNWRIIIDW